MADLRWVLLAAGVLILCGIFVWTRYRSQIRDRLPVLQRREPVLDAAVEVADPPAATPVAPQAPPPVPQVVTIRLLCRDAPGFPAEELVLALRETGLRHGRYGIFHRLDGEAETPRFSVANLVEPGSFDLTRLRTETYPGISLFMIVEPSLDPVGTFDDMVATARDLSRQLGGELVDEQGSTLSIQRERYLREELIQLRHRQGVAG